MGPERNHPGPKLKETKMSAIGELRHICTELDGSDKRTNELEAAVADAMAIIRQYYLWQK